MYIHRCCLFTGGFACCCFVDDLKSCLFSAETAKFISFLWTGMTEWVINEEFCYSILSLRCLGCKQLQVCFFIFFGPPQCLSYCCNISLNDTEYQSDISIDNSGLIYIRASLEPRFDANCYATTLSHFVMCFNIHEKEKHSHLLLFPKRNAKNFYDCFKIKKIVFVTFLWAELNFDARRSMNVKSQTELIICQMSQDTFWEKQE